MFAYLLIGLCLYSCVLFNETPLKLWEHATLCVSLVLAWPLVLLLALTV